MAAPYTLPNMALSPPPLDTLPRWPLPSNMAATLLLPYTPYQWPPPAPSQHPPPNIHCVRLKKPTTKKKERDRQRERLCFWIQCLVCERVREKYGSWLYLNCT
ncbi:unnamed protein product [Lota lota]